VEWSNVTAVRISETKDVDSFLEQSHPKNIKQVKQRQSFFHNPMPNASR